MKIKEFLYQCLKQKRLYGLQGIEQSNQLRLICGKYIDSYEQFLKNELGE